MLGNSFQLTNIKYISGQALVVQFGILIVNNSTTQSHNYHWALYHINTSFIVSSTSTFNGEDELHFCHVTSLRKYLKNMHRNNNIGPQTKNHLGAIWISKKLFLWNTLKYMHAPYQKDFVITIYGHSQVAFLASQVL